METNSNEEGILDEMKQTITPIELHQFQLVLTKSCLELAKQHGEKDRTCKYYFPNKIDDILDIL